MLKYGDSKNYLHHLDNDKLNWIIEKTNRSKHQTLFLYQLVDGQWELLVHLEKQLKNLHIKYCPDTKEDVKKILNLKSKNDWFQF